MNFDRSVSGKEILNWKTIELLRGGESREIEWLLDVGGGISCSEISQLKLIQDRKYQLNLALEELSEIWGTYLNEQIPLQYLLGKCCWRDFEIEVNPSVLIPRPETELLIDIALEKINPSSNESGIWVDLGTGSGVLAIALARAFSTWTGHAVDCSQKALDLAKKNLRNLVFDSKVSFHLGDWCEPLYPLLLDRVDLIVANPPYIPKAFLSNLDSVVIRNEPYLALYGGVDGMVSSQKVIDGAINCLSSGGWLIFEHHFDQSERALEMLVKAGFVEVSYQNDLQGIRRFAMGRQP